MMLSFRLGHPERRAHDRICWTDAVVQLAPRMIMMAFLTIQSMTSHHAFGGGGSEKSMAAVASSPGFTSITLRYGLKYLQYNR